jgi:hypothetical protein
MQDFGAIGRWLVILGLAIVVTGALIWLLSRIPGVKELPGTLQINLGGLTCIVPVLASILLSILLTVILNLLLRLWRH